MAMAGSPASKSQKIRTGNYYPSWSGLTRTKRLFRPYKAFFGRPYSLFFLICLCDKSFNIVYKTFSLIFIKECLVVLFFVELHYHQNISVIEFFAKM